jgi:hypothetical protein
MYVIHSSRRSSPPLNILYNGNPIEQVSTFKLLGVIIDHHLTWTCHIDFVVKRVSSNLHVSFTTSSSVSP